MVFWVELGRQPKLKSFHLIFFNIKVSSTRITQVTELSFLHKLVEKNGWFAQEHTQALPFPFFVTSLLFKHLQSIMLMYIFFWFMNNKCFWVSNKIPVQFMYVIIFWVSFPHVQFLSKIVLTFHFEWCYTEL